VFSNSVRPVLESSGSGFENENWTNGERQFKRDSDSKRFEAVTERVLAGDAA
jgi:hypothetical protein